MDCIRHLSRLARGFWGTILGQCIIKVVATSSAILGGFRFTTFDKYMRGLPLDQSASLHPAKLLHSETSK
jgi:hypothetical protein